MANRPVFVSLKNKPFVTVFKPEFNWNGGFAASQKQKNIQALHTAFARSFPDKKVLEISSKSLQTLGVKLSAFNLRKYVPSLGKSVPLECVFQGGKIFKNGGPFTDLYEATPREAKKDPRLKENGFLRCFYFEGTEIPLIPTTAFYNWLYISALNENTDLIDELMEYDAFTDIEFNPDKSKNCQAEAAALFVSLKRQGSIDKCKDFNSFLEIVRR